MSARKYLKKEEMRCKKAKKSYLNALRTLRATCTHQVVLEHTNENYTAFYVCEGCGVTCVAEWNSPAHAVGEKLLMGRRTYAVSWSDFVNNTALYKLNPPEQNRYPWS